MNNGHESFSIFWSEVLLEYQWENGMLEWFHKIIQETTLSNMHHSSVCYKIREIQIWTYYKPPAMQCSKMQELERMAVPLKHAAFKKCGMDME